MKVKPSTILMNSGVVVVAFAGLLLAVACEPLTPLRNPVSKKVSAGQDIWRDHDVFDFIVVGAGAAGCVVANRLSEVAEWNVLLLEAGGDETSTMDIPFTSGPTPSADWNYTLAPQSHGGCPLGPDGRCPFPRGFVMGGSTTVSSMMFVRGNSRDFDHWAALGNDGWDYDSVLPYFKKMENIHVPELRDSPFHGTEGNLMISELFDTLLTNYSLETARLLHIPEVDYNGAHQSGIARPQTTIYNGSRWSANRGYIQSIRRKNLSLRKHALVSKVLIVDGTAIGVEYITDNTTRRVFARKEVILSAGAINSPQLLILSGVGPRDHLEELGIPVLKDLPVGRTLYDHSIFLGLLIKVNASVGLTRNEMLSNPDYATEYFANYTGPYSARSELHVIRFYKADESSSSLPNIESLALSQPFITDRNIALSMGFTDEFFRNFSAPIANDSVFQVLVVNNKPKSKGTVALLEANIYVSPVIDPNYFADPKDLDDSVMGIEEAVNFSTSGAFARLGAQVYATPVPQCAKFKVGTRKYWSCAVRSASVTAYHPCSTCKMGPRGDSSAVVRPDLQVWGVEGLRVIDASVMPSITNGHIQAPVCMIAEKGADLIKCKYLKQGYCHT